MQVLEWLDSEDGLEWVEKAFSLEKVKRYLRTRSPVGMADPDGCRARDVAACLFDGDDDATHTLLRDVLIMPYLTGDFDENHMPSERVTLSLLLLHCLAYSVTCTLCALWWARPGITTLTARSIQ
jgi:hypothetical protein